MCSQTNLCYNKCILALVWISHWFCQNVDFWRASMTAPKIIITVITSYTFCSGTLWKETCVYFSWVVILHCWWWIRSPGFPCHSFAGSAEMKWQQKAGMLLFLFDPTMLTWCLYAIHSWQEKTVALWPSWIFCFTPTTKADTWLL